MGLFCFRNNVYVRERQANSEAVASDHHQPRNEKDMSFVHLKHLQPWKSRVDNFLTRGNTKEKGIRMVSRKKWLILAFLNKKALCKSVASWSSGKAGKAGAILLVFALQKPFALPQEASHSGNKHSGRIILLSEIPDIIFPRRFFQYL